MSINARIKEIRKSLHLSQKDFASRIGLKQGAISWMEQEGNNIVEQNVKQICSIFHVNEQWLRTGEGSPTAPSTKDLLDEVSEEFNLSPLQKEALRIIMSFPSDVREKLAKAFFAVLDARAAGETFDGDRAASIDRKKAIINEEMEARKGAPTSPASTNTSGNTAGGRK